MASLLEINNNINNVINQLGVGIFEPVAYDTAWIARIPQKNDFNKPAFPNSLQWLRDNQLTDGSWGSEFPLYAHANTLSTLASVLSLSHWNYTEDQLRMEKGINSLWALSEKLTEEPIESSGFELLMPAYIADAKDKGISLPFDTYSSYLELAQKKMLHLVSHQEKYGFQEPAAWWFSLELLYKNDLIGQKIKYPSPEYLLGDDGLVGASPSATAYLLMSYRNRGLELPKAEIALSHLSEKYHYGMPHHISNILEICWVLDFLIKGGVSIKDKMLEPGIKLLFKFWNENDQKGVGFSSYFPVVDSDDTATAIYLLRSAGYHVDIHHLLNYFNGEYFRVYHDERNASISVNINQIPALRQNGGTTKIDHALKKVTAWLEKQIINGIRTRDKRTLYDKWNFSYFYNLSRIVFALEGINNQLTQSCIDWMLEEQQKDGGWGAWNKSTQEETAYVVLALCFWKRSGHFVPHNVLENANNFLDSFPDPYSKEPLWMAKVLYKPRLMAASAILGAQYALKQVIEK